MQFVFGRKQLAVFGTLKAKLAKAMKLTRFDKRAPTKVIAEAGPVGLGAVLIQEQSEGTVLFYVQFYALFSCILYDHKTNFYFEKFNKVSCILSRCCELRQPQSIEH